MPAVSSIRITPGTGAISFSSAAYQTPAYTPPKVVSPSTPAQITASYAAQNAAPGGIAYVPTSATPKVVSPTKPVSGSGSWVTPNNVQLTQAQINAVCASYAAQNAAPGGIAYVPTSTTPQFLYAGHFTQAIANNSTIQFDSGHSEAVLSIPQSLQATLSNFGYGNDIQLQGFHNSTLSFSNNHITLTDAKDHLSDSFTLTDGISVRGTYSAANFSMHETTLGEVISFVPH